MKNDKGNINGKEELGHYYFENGLMVFTEKYHLARGYCCGNKCRHGPFQYKNVKS